MATLTLEPFLKSERIEPGSINIDAAPFPPTIRSLPEDPAAIASAAVKTFNAALESKDFETVSNLFAENGYWRDHLCLSFDLRTLKGRGRILSFLETRCRLNKLTIDASTSVREPQVAPFDPDGNVKVLQFFIKVDTDIGFGRGVVRMIEEEATKQWKICTFYTCLEGLKGHEEKVRHKRAMGVTHGGERDEKNWQDLRVSSTDSQDYNPIVLIVGAGQAGITVAARLKMLGVSALLVDKHKRIGDSWRNRYHQLVLHDPVWYDHLPYIPFPDTWPVFSPKDKIAGWFEAYVQALELDAWTNTAISGTPSWDDAKRQWTVILDRTKPDGTKETRTLHPRHVIQATGHSGKKNMPEIQGMSSFQGDLLCHSSEFRGAKPESKGKNAIVVGSCNSSHDICQDFYSRGYNITMIQRSSTCIVSSYAITDIGLKGLYDEDSPPTEDADLLFYSIPAEYFKQYQMRICQLQNENDKETLAGLQKAGFKLDNGPGDGGFFVKYFQRGGGYCLDVGASQLIIDGKIKIKSGAEPTLIGPHEVTFSDGTTLPADEIVFATGYQNMRTEARSIFGDELADRVGDVWGFDSEGEHRGIWRRTGHPGFWFMGGNLALCRYYSRLLALTIKATEEGLVEGGDGANRS